MPGKVFLVGAGPGDAGLITVKGLRCLEGAEVLVYDRLINESLLSAAPKTCEKIYVGKAAADHSLPQDQINALLYEKAAAGKRVVRLKGGDPYVFGRGGEEAIYLVKRGIEVEVVPGITSSIAGPCYAGIPVTHRDWVSSFHVFTGNFKDRERGLDFATIAAMEGTLIFLMGFGNLSYIADGLLAAGKDAATPAAVISNATTVQQKTVEGTLADIAARCAAAQLRTPALIVVGQVIDCRRYLGVGEEGRPRRVLIMRDADQSDVFARMLVTAGYEPVVCPLIAIAKRETSREVREALQRLATYTWLVFTSPNGAKIFFDILREEEIDRRALGHLKFAVIGQATANVLWQYGFKADLIPAKQVSDALGEVLATHLEPDDRVLLPRSALADNRLAAIIGERCPVTDLRIYDTLTETQHTENLRSLLRDGHVDYIPFTSASTVDALYQALQGDTHSLTALKTVAIGPVTAARLKERGIVADAEAVDHSLQGIIDTLGELEGHGKTEKIAN